MNPEQFRALVELADRRNEKHYGFLRQLLVLASGALAALVAFRSGHSTGMALWCLRTAWAALGLGILGGAAALHGEVAAAAALAQKAAEEALASRSRGDQQPVPIAAKLPARYKWFARICYASLLLAVAALVAFALLDG